MNSSPGTAISWPLRARYKSMGIAIVVHLSDFLNVTLVTMCCPFVSIFVSINDIRTCNVHNRIHIYVCVCVRVLACERALMQKIYYMLVYLSTSKTKVMMENDTPINVNNNRIEDIESYIYLGQIYSIRDKNQDKESQRRITARWTAFAKNRDIFKANIGTCNSCVIPAMTYGAETWALTTLTKIKQGATQKRWKKVNITCRNRKTNIWVREITMVTNVIYQVRGRK